MISTLTINFGATLNITGTLTLGGIGTASGKWGSTSSSATHKNDTYFAVATGMMNVGTGSCPSFSAVISGNNFICSGNSTNLKVTISGGTSPYTVVYSGGTHSNNSMVRSGGGLVYGGASTGGSGASGSVIITFSCAPACMNPTSAGEISGNQTICSGSDPDVFTSSSGASGYTGTLDYKWQYSNANNPYGWEDLSSSNSADYDDSQITFPTRWYRRLARVTCSAGWI